MMTTCVARRVARFTTPSQERRRRKWVVSTSEKDRRSGGRTTWTPRVRSYGEKRLSEKVPPARATDEAKVAPRDVAPATVNRELAMLRRMLRLGADDGLVARVPKIRLLREASARAGFVDEAQYRALAKKLRRDLAVVIAIGYNFGWRIKSEVLTLEKRQVDMERGIRRLDAGTTKHKEGRVVY